MLSWYAGADLGGGCRGCAPPPLDELRLSNTTGILKKKKKTSVTPFLSGAPPPKKNPGSAPGMGYINRAAVFYFLAPQFLEDFSCFLEVNVVEYFS